MFVISHTSQNSTITSASQQVTLAPGERYRLASDVACWIAQGDNPTAAPGSGTYLPANSPVGISSGAGNTKLAVIRAVGDGNLSISRLL